MISLCCRLLFNVPQVAVRTETIDGIGSRAGDECSSSSSNCTYNSCSSSNGIGIAAAAVVSRNYFFQ